MAPAKINVLITSFTGSGLPPTLSLPLPPTAPVTALLDELDSRLPAAARTTTSTTRFLLTTISSRAIPLTSTLPISHYLPVEEGKEEDETNTNNNAILSLRLHPALCGGKGGFGSQLRAAGGRMSKRKKGGNPADEHGSSRNLDGRRLRTVNEAKALAEYLAVKPEMDRAEKEKRRQRWEEIVEMAERKQEEIKYGSKRVGLDGKWVEDKEEVGDRTREAVLEVMRKGVYRDNLVDREVGSGSGSGSGSASSGEDEMMEDREEGEESGGSKATTPPSEPEPVPDAKGKGKAVANGKGAGPATARKFAGFDDDDEFMSSSDEES
ncbi:telomere stability and silencing-domain-containing protein [Dichotomopilus funicola]|uniref:Telomere stability and silencing-domain-containing protein n=1 Tax=Dichotomopilus funicola TaxID=1934379 RepID=A0AAN6ZHX2_9PEZI|nr:telomere stability and silencing-domain-containing protein [Dichotomopilus funicola]